MRYLITVNEHFDAGHQLLTEPCDKPGHGHHYEVDVVVGGDLGPRKIPEQDRYELLDDVRRLLAELHGRNLNVMLAATSPTLENIALQLMERLRFRWPRIEQVTVAQDDTSSVTIVNEGSP